MSWIQPSLFNATSSSRCWLITLPAVLESHLLAHSGEEDRTIYSESKFVQLLAAHWWRRQLQGSCDVVAVSPGLIPQTGITRYGSVKLSMDMPDAKTVPEGEFAAYKQARARPTNLGWGPTVYRRANMDISQAPRAF